MNYYLNLVAKIFLGIFLLYFVFFLIVLCVDEKKLKIKNTNRRKITENAKNRSMNKVSKSIIEYGKNLGNKLSIKKKN